MRRGNAARQWCQVSVGKHGSPGSRAATSLIDRRGLHGNRFDRDVYRRSCSKASRGWGHHARRIQRYILRVAVEVEHHAPERGIHHDRGEGNACRQRARGNYPHPRKDATPAWDSQPLLDTLLQARRRLNISQPAQGFIDFRVHAHCKIPSCSSSAASACRARNSRERMVDSVVLRMRAISTVDNSLTADSSRTSRSFSGRLSIRRRILA
jgi:hypothetical protein